MHGLVGYGVAERPRTWTARGRVAGYENRQRPSLPQRVGSH